MIGYFLEIAIRTTEIKASLEFYEALAFRQATTGEIWDHPYAVLTDGRAFIGLHSRDFRSPCVTFVRPQLAAHLDRLEELGIELESRRLGEESFNEATFLDPDGYLVCLLEARTYSPPSFDREDFSLCGRFAELSLPVRSLDASVAFWEPLGFVSDPPGEEAATHRLLTSDGINLGLYEGPGLRRPALTFREPDMDERIARLRNAGFDISATAPGQGAPAVHGSLVAPEGTVILLGEDEDP